MTGQLYGVPYEWYEKYGIRRYGFHGASHRYAAEKVMELEGRERLRHVNCHLGGSSSLCGVKDGVSHGASHGLSPPRLFRGVSFTFSTIFSGQKSKKQLSQNFVDQQFSDYFSTKKFRPAFFRITHFDPK